MTGPLSGLRVIDLTSVIMGPYATSVLGDLGAEVVKIELPEGDVGRGLGPSRNAGMSALALNLLRNKRSVVINFDDDSAAGRLSDFIAGADAIVTNLRPASRKRLGLDWESVQEVNPNAVLCTAQAYASESSRGGAPAYDDVIQAVSGGVDIYRRAWGEPRFSPSVVADKICGLFIVNSVLAALLHVRSGGRGQWVDVPMADAMLSFNLVEHLSGQTFVPPLGDFGWERTLVPQRAPHRATDGWICVMPYSDKNWRDFFNAVGRPDLAEDPRFSSPGQRHRNAGPLQTILGHLVSEHETAHWLNLCSELGVAAEPVLDLDEAQTHPYYQERGTFQTLDHPSEGSYRHVRYPVDFHSTPIGAPRPAARLGQDNEFCWPADGSDATVVSEGSGKSRTEKHV